MRRVQLMMLITVGGLLCNLLGGYVADAMIERNTYQGPYIYEGTVFDKYERTDQATGFIEEYTNGENFCTSWVIVPGTQLLSVPFQGVFYVLVLFYLFLGIALVSDIFMEAIEVITSKMETVIVPDADGNMISVDKPVWNATIANLTLMALGSSAPEIILSVLDTVTKLEETPSELGPQAIVGSAAFNLLVISAVSIVSVTEVKYIRSLGVFVITAIFSTFAYVWFFLVLTVISPGRVELWEAGLTLGFMLVLVICAFAADKASERSLNKEDKKKEMKRLASKSALRVLRKKFGIRAMLDVARTNQPTKEINKAEVDKIVGYFCTVLEVDSLADIGIEGLLDALDPENPIERISYRKQFAQSTTNNPQFARIGKNTKGESAWEKEKSADDNPEIGFKHVKYEVSECNGYVSITIAKRVDKEMTVWVRTLDDTAKAPKDYEPKNELITMKEHEDERVYKIKIHDDEDYQPDKDFKVQLLEEIEQTQLPGVDTECVVTIIDEDKPGNLGFEQRFMTVSKKDSVVYLKIERTGGADGEISCKVNTINDVNQVSGKRAARPGIDYVPIIDRQIVFKANVVEYRLELEMPDCEEQEDEDDTFSLLVQLSDPTPSSVALSRKDSCFIDIEPSSNADQERADFERERLLDFFLSNKDISWGQQFKIACQLGPSIDEDNKIDDITCGEGLMHFLAIFWKVVFAIIPPRSIWGGWAAFIVALAVIGVITMIVGEVATILGCAIGLKASVTGITLVAMGTSLPDTFASKTAAQDSEFADSAVGNITGSNSVNVFMGLGLPWVIATVYWKVNFDSDYEVPPGSLAFSVFMFLSCSIACFLILALRRCIVRGELGGSSCGRNFSAFLIFLLWITYIVFCTLEAYGQVDTSFLDLKRQ